MALGDGIGKRIQEVREAREVSKSALARAVNVSGMAVINWEKNQIAPRAPTLARVAAFLRVSEEYLRSGKGSVDIPIQDLPLGHSGTSVGDSEPTSIAEALEQAKLTIAALAGLDPLRVKLHLEFLSD